MNAIDLIKSQLQQKRAEVDRLHDDIEALERTLKILEQQHGPDQRIHRGTPVFAGGKTGSSRKGQIQKNSIPWFVQSFLRDSGKAMSGDDLLARFAMKGKQVKKTTMMGAIYRLVKKEQVFSLPKPGTFGLIEWEGRQP